MNILSRLIRIRIEFYAYATILVAFFLRVHRLADKNIWWDEGWSLWLARQDWIAIALRTASDEHPPLHYWMLRAWDSVAGGDAFTARFLSVAFGVLTVALVYRIASHVVTRPERSAEGAESKDALPRRAAWIGIIAALFLATARFHIWWSQDVKNYTSSIFFAYAAVWLALNFGIRNSDFGFSRHSSLVTRHSLLYALFAALALWTHYLAALVLLALNVYVLILFVRSRRLITDHRSLITWILANALAAAFFVPWLLLYLQNAAAWTAAPVFDFGLFARLVATVLPLGVTTEIENYAVVVIVFTAIVCIGALPDWQNRIRRAAIRNTQHASILFALIVLLPPLLIYLLSLTPVSFFAPKIQARYLLILLPAYAILLAFGIAKLARLSRSFASFAILFAFLASAFVLRDYYADRRRRDEYATLANTINAYARQGDLVLLDTDQEWPTFLYYLRAPLDWTGAPNGKPMRAEDADALVTRALARHPAVWLVAIPDALATDPQKLLEARLARELPKTKEWTFDDKRLALYARDARDLAQVAPANLNIQHPLPFIAFPKPADANERIASLTGFDLPVREARAGDSLRVATYWHAVATRGEMQLADAAGRVAAVAAMEIATGKDVRVVSDLRVPADAAGEYTVRVKVAETMVALTRVSVEPRAPAAGVGQIANRVDYAFGNSIRLVGYDLPRKKVNPNSQLQITLYWRADRAIEKSYIAFVHVLGAQFNAAQGNFLWGQADRVPGDGKFPTNAWRVGEIVPDVYRVLIDASAPLGAYKIEIGLYDPATGTRLVAPDGADSVIVAEIEVTR